ncbi:sensor histidine kinase [Paenibacillus puldeungensis]|uniref:histidine kinase n=1 Tax=Paenibacillus puldeungensis TaxID=696536 RepID=A0ABW3RSW8_9BACL
MRTIKSKVLLSLFISMLVTVGITVAMFVRFMDGILVNQARAQLHVQAERAVHMLSDGDLERLDSKKFKYVVKGLLLYADYMVLDNKQLIIDASDSVLEGKTLKTIPRDREGITQINGHKVLYTNEPLPRMPYHIFIYSPLSSLRAIYVPLMNTTLLSIGASFLVILGIGLLVVSRVVRPLNRLKEAVSRYEPNRLSIKGLTDFPKSDNSEIGELSHTFQMMSDRIELHQRSQIEFLQNVSHELRTPLMSIQGYVYAIQDQVVTQEEGLKIITNQSRRLIDMVEKLLQLSRLEAVDDQWPLTEVDLHEMAEEAIQLLMPAAKERQLEMSVDGKSFKAKVPAEQVFRIMINLLQNAVRHTTKRVVLRVHQGADPDTEWTISVEDDGPGLSEEEREAVFKRFYTGARGVTGLGLEICRQIALKMNGNISYSPSDWGGACFTVVKYHYRNDAMPPNS